MHCQKLCVWNAILSLSDTTAQESSLAAAKHSFGRPMNLDTIRCGTSPRMQRALRMACLRETSFPSFPNSCSTCAIIETNAAELFARDHATIDTARLVQQAARLLENAGLVGQSGTTARHRIMPCVKSCGSTTTHPCRFPGCSC